MSFLNGDWMVVRKCLGQGDAYSYKGWWVCIECVWAVAGHAHLWILPRATVRFDMSMLQHLSLLTSYVPIVLYLSCPSEQSVKPLSKLY